MTGWCGPKMAFDADNQRCEFSYSVKCENGERKDWVPPEGWMGTTRSTTTTTKRTRMTAISQSTTKADASDRVTGAAEGAMKENEACSFEGLVADKKNCERYFYCKDGLAHRATCIQGEFFDEESKSCKESGKVTCGERPLSSESDNRCKSRPNGSKYTPLLFDTLIQTLDPKNLGVLSLCFGSGPIWVWIKNLVLYILV